MANWIKTTRGKYVNLDNVVLIMTTEEEEKGNFAINYISNINRIEYDEFKTAEEYKAKIKLIDEKTINSDNNHK